jgi:hypothetical protein
LRGHFDWLAVLKVDSPKDMRQKRGFLSLSGLLLSVHAVKALYGALCGRRAKETRRVAPLDEEEDL